MKEQEKIYDPYNILESNLGEDALIMSNGDIHIPIWPPEEKVGGYHLSMDMVYLKKTHYPFNICEALTSAGYDADFYPSHDDLAISITLRRGKQSYSHRFSFEDICRLAAYISKVTGYYIPNNYLYNLIELPILRTIHYNEAIDIRPSGFPPKLFCSSCKVIYDPNNNARFPWQISIFNHHLIVSVDGEVGEPIATRKAFWQLTTTSMCDIVEAAAEVASQGFSFAL